MRQRARWLVAAVILSAASLACTLASGGSSTPPAVATLGQLYTAAALTLQASNSQVASASSSPTALSGFPTFSLGTPSRTPAPAVLCDAASFVKDVTISDGSSLDPGADFTKTWRIQNIGSCSWTPAYALVFVSGDRMRAPASRDLDTYVNPGQSVDVSVPLTAPTTNGNYQGYWKMRNAAGALFGIGIQAATAFWVQIEVVGPTYTVYDFVGSYCDAQWQNNSRDLPCPGSKGDGKGFVIRIKRPVMENGSTADEAALLTVPKESDGGFISGQYPAVKIRDGDRFRALVNCQYGAYACNVMFRLDYQIGDRDPHRFGIWNEAYEGQYYPVDVDLSTLAGQKVKFTLVVMANGSPAQDNALWVAPRITRLGIRP